MAKIISIINQPSSDSLMCILDLAKLLIYAGNTVCVVEDEAYQTLLFNYQLRLVEIADIGLYASVDDIQDEQIALYNGYYQAADWYILLVKQDIFEIKSLSSHVQQLNLTKATFVMYDALDVKQDIDYVYQVYFERFVDCQNKVSIMLDEREKERHYLSQLGQTIDLKGTSRQRLAAYRQILTDIVDSELNSVRQLHQLVRRG